MQILFPFSVIYKNRRGSPPRRFSLFLSRASLREFSFLALSRDIIPLDCVFFHGILSRLTMSFSAEFYSAFIFFFFRAIRLPASYVRFCGIIFRPTARCIDAPSSALSYFLPGNGIYLLPAEDEDLTVDEDLTNNVSLLR